MVDYEALPQSRLADVLQEIFECPQWARRAEPRIPYFGPVTISPQDGSGAQLSAFARDLSVGGIGLVHLMPLETGDVVIALPRPSGELISLWAEIRWCRDYKDGWYASGGKLLDVVQA